MDEDCSTNAVSRPTNPQTSSIVSFSSSSMLTNTLASPSSSLTSILTNSPSSNSEFSSSSSNSITGVSATAIADNLAASTLVSLNNRPSSSQLAQFETQQASHKATRSDDAKKRQLGDQYAISLSETNVAQHEKENNDYYEEDRLEYEQMNVTNSQRLFQEHEELCLRSQQRQDQLDAASDIAAKEASDEGTGLQTASAEISGTMSANVVNPIDSMATTTVDLLLEHDATAAAVAAASATLRGRQLASSESADAMADAMLMPTRQEYDDHDAANECLSYCDDAEPAATGSRLLPLDASFKNVEALDSCHGMPHEQNRLERSNSCSQAECGSTGAAAVNSSNGKEFIPISLSFLGQTTSISHDNLTTAAEAAPVSIVPTTTVLESTNPIDHSNVVSIVPDDDIVVSDAPDNTCHILSKSPVTDSTKPSVDSNRESPNVVDKRSASISNQWPSAVGSKVSTPAAIPIPKTSNTSSSSLAAAYSYSSAFSSSSARFLSSKLNTGSLWSLLSVGSSNSSVINEPNQANEYDTEQCLYDNKQQQMVISNNSNRNNSCKLQDNKSSSATATTTSSGSFLSRYQFMRPQTSTGQQQHSSSISSSASVSANNNTSNITDQSQKREMNPLDRKRYRFNVKYIGSALLHKNFTLPMLEWIAKDIRRQTIRGAQSTTQRQITIPSREIIFEIQSNQLTAISCRDNHAIFVHPMHCVSKYVQLQHDSTCFAYIIREAKDAPSFCHVFQAKSLNKVHDIFSAIRETTTRAQLYQHHQAVIPSAEQLLAISSASASNRPLQKSASTDGHWRSLLNPSPAIEQTKIINNIACQPALPNTMSTAVIVEGTGTSAAKINALGPNHNQLASVGGGDSVNANLYVNSTTNTIGQSQSQAQIQFENSYQFEVMFVKRVKLQCRRVPATFVDDALETLKSYEVSLKGSHSDSKTAQIKGVGKRIINASVDERQEYDESCQSPTPVSQQKTSFSSKDQGRQQLSNTANDGQQSGYKSNENDGQRRGSSASLKCHGNGLLSSGIDHDLRESKSCQQSPTKLSTNCHDIQEEQQPILSENDKSNADKQQHIKKHQSVDCLESIRDKNDLQQTPYANDFSPYNTITSSDLNERIAAIPVVSGNSVSLDHETRQKLARQVRETIMATAANIKRGVYASGDKLDSISSSKAIDSLSCSVIGSVSPPPDQLKISSPDTSELNGSHQSKQENSDMQDKISSYNQDKSDTQQVQSKHDDEYRRSSAFTSIFQRNNQPGNQSVTGGNNFDLFRRASARQVVKNRTMLLLIGKDELCAISIDKHQMLFSKSFNSIVHCLQGINNKDHFGLICRDSVKINPQAESYAGYVFKCQSEKVVREIMGALKQVIYSSQHNYHGYNSPYNPLNLVVANATTVAQSKQQRSPKLDRLHSSSSSNSSFDQNKQQQQQYQIIGLKQNAPIANASQNSSIPSTANELSLAAKRGFSNTIELDEAKAKTLTTDIAVSGATTPTTAPVLIGHQQQQQQQQLPAKNLIKSMFCDNCPLYWYHRLCCDVESLPAEASKTIILRRIDSSLSEKEQDEVYSRFSEFNIDSIEEHNEIFMSILRHQCEKKQSKHGQSRVHLAALAKQASLARQQSNVSMSSAKQQHQLIEVPSSSARASSASRLESSSSIQPSASAFQHQKYQPSGNTTDHSHQRSGSTSGTLALMLTGQQQHQPNPSGHINEQGHHYQSTTTMANQVVDASSAAIDNLKRAKNSISVSIENMLKRRSSMKDELQGDDQDASNLPSVCNLPIRSGSFRCNSRESRTTESQYQSSQAASDQNQGDSMGILKRSQSTNDYARGNTCNTATTSASSWRDSISRTLNESADLASTNNPLVGFFRRRGSMAKSEQQNEHDHQSQPIDQQQQSKTTNTRASNESLHISSDMQHQHQAASGGESPLFRSLSRPHPVSANGGGTPSPMLSMGVFWKKSIFDKIRQPVVGAMGDWGNNTSNQQQTIADKQQQQQQQPQQQINRERHDLGSTNDTTSTTNPPTRRKTREELRSLWKKAILEQITLLKMDKQNQKLQNTTTLPTPTSKSPQDIVEQPKSEHEYHGNHIQDMKLNYRDVPYGREAPQLWSRLLGQDPTTKVEFLDVVRLVRLGIPKHRRGEVWMFLMNQYQLRHGTNFQPADNEFHGDANQTYRSLLSQLSTQQHEIFVDIDSVGQSPRKAFDLSSAYIDPKISKMPPSHRFIIYVTQLLSNCRTFPTHPYYSQYLSIGQLSLFNLLKAYSLLDQEVGYCQGLSFVAGILLLHVEGEDEAFELMRHLLFNFGLRKQYLPSMNALHLQLYQMTRLLRDHEYDLFNHFDNLDISPSLYAAPWFLTLFASQFPLGFVSRLLDLIFLIGIEAIFRVSLTLLTYHRKSILECPCLEATMDFMRRDLVKIDDKNLTKIFDRSLSLDLRNKLIEYEIEYSFYCAEDKIRAGQSLPLSKSISASSNNQKEDMNSGENKKDDSGLSESTSKVAAATATVIIQHLLANNHLKSMRSNYTY